jgi:hypothetical protein
VTHGPAWIVRTRCSRSQSRSWGCGSLRARHHVGHAHGQDFRFYLEVVFSFSQPSPMLTEVAPPLPVGGTLEASDEIRRMPLTPLARGRDRSELPTNFVGNALLPPHLRAERSDEIRRNGFPPLPPPRTYGRNGCVSSCLHCLDLLPPAPTGGTLDLPRNRARIAYTASCSPR